MNSISSIDPRGAAHAVSLSMRAMEARLESVASNLANANTTAHKRVTAFYESFRGELDRQQEGIPAIQLATRRDFRQGEMVETGNAHDLALMGQGFLGLEHDGEVQYARAAKITVDADGYLVNQQGLRLLGTAGPVRLPDPLAEPVVDKDGTVNVNGEPVGKLRLVGFDREQDLEEAGPGLFRTAENQAPVRPQDLEVWRGYKESSNVNPLQEMVNLISIQRQFQSSQRALTTHADMRRTLIQSLR